MRCLRVGCTKAPPQGFHVILCSALWEESEVVSWQVKGIWSHIDREYTEDVRDVPSLIICGSARKSQDRHIHDSYSSSRKECKRHISARTIFFARIAHKNKEQIWIILLRIFVCVSLRRKNIVKLLGIWRLDETVSRLFSSFSPNEGIISSKQKKNVQIC